MNDASLIKDLCEKQIESALEDTLLHSECYLAAQKEVEKEMADLLQLNLNTEQLTAIDRVITASNEFGTEYGRVAYHQGFQDGVKLIAEIIDIASEPSDTKNQSKDEYQKTTQSFIFALSKYMGTFLSHSAIINRRYTYTLQSSGSS